MFGTYAVGQWKYAVSFQKPSRDEWMSYFPENPTVLSTRSGCRKAKLTAW